MFCIYLSRDYKGVCGTSSHKSDRTHGLQYLHEPLRTTFDPSGAQHLLHSGNILNPAYILSAYVWTFVTLLRHYRLIVF